MLTEIEQQDAAYNARDVLGMCRVFPLLVEGLEQTNTVEVYEHDEQQAYLALQMTRVGLPVNSERRAEIGARLRTLRDAAIVEMRPYTEEPYREEFLNWVAAFFAVKARKGEPTAGVIRVGPTRAAQEYEEARTTLANWKAYRKQLTDDGTAGAIYSDSTVDREIREITLGEDTDTQIAKFTEIVKEKKLALAVSQFVSDEEDGLVHTEETAYAVRHAIRKAQAILAIEKKGVNFGAKVQQCAILRAAGVPLHRKTEKTGLPKIDKEILEGLARHKAAKALLSYILTEKTINVYIEGEKRAGKNGGKAKPVMVTEDGYIHPLWGVHRITGRWNSSPNCFDGETEYLTNQGWIRADAFSKLSSGLKVAQFDKDSRTIAFVKPEAVIEKHYTGDMLRLQRRNIDLLVTPEHRLLLGTRTGVWNDVLACNFVEDRKMWLAGECYTFGSEKYSAAWIAFLCAAQADGHWNTSGWTFGFTRERKIQRMRWLLRELNLCWTEGTDLFDNPFQPGTRRQRTIFYILKNDVGDDIHARLGDEKVFGPWLLHFHRGAVEMFLYEIMLWDGSFTRRDCYSSSQKVNADWIQLLFTLTGRRAYLRDYTGSELQTKINWQIDVSAKVHTWTTNTETSVVPWDGKVYCISVPSSYIVVRRNGKTMVVGQCQNWSKRAGGGTENLREMIEAPEGYTLIGADQKQLEARLIAAMSGCKYMLDTFQRGEDIHSAFALIGFPDEWPRLVAIFKDHKKGGKCNCKDCELRNQMRDRTKNLEYGAFYGGQEQKLFEAIVKDFPEATLGQVREFLRRFNAMLPEVVAWREAVLAEAIKTGEIRSPILGRRQVFPLGRVDPNVAFNYKAQAGGADIWAIGAVKFMKLWNQEEFDARLIQNGHDSVLILVREELAEQVEQDVYKCWNMEWGGVPFEMESKIAKQWSET